MTEKSVVEALWMVKSRSERKARTERGTLAMLDDRRIVGGNHRYHFVGIYRCEAGRIFFRVFVAFHGERRRSSRPRERVPYEAEGIGEISPDRKRIEYVARIVGRPESQLDGSFVRIAEVPNFRNLPERPAGGRMRTPSQV